MTLGVVPRHPQQRRRHVSRRGQAISDDQLAQRFPPPYVRKGWFAVASIALPEARVSGRPACDARKDVGHRPTV